MASMTREPFWRPGRRTRKVLTVYGAIGLLAVTAAGFVFRFVASLIPFREPMPPAVVEWALPPDWDGGPSPALVLSYAGITYMNGGPADPVIELKVILVNSGERHTDSTSIRWEPSFAREYTVLKSDPPAWRVRIDDWGWGVYDGPGVLPRRDGTYLVWFTRTGFRVDEPRIQAIGNGNIFVDDTYAIAMNRILNREPATQGIFERMPLAAVVDQVGGAVPDAIVTAPFGFAIALAGTLCLLTVGGMVAALRRAPDVSLTPTGEDLHSQDAYAPRAGAARNGT
jgi:hypothetical protein